MQATRLLSLAVFTALSLVGACGGKQTSDKGSGSGGSANASGSGGSGAFGGSGAQGGSGAVGGAGPCAEGAPCSKAGETCTPANECCPCSYSCDGQVWHTAACPGCVAPICPATAPADGAACGPCDALINGPCVYDECSSAGQLAAICNASTWQLTVSDCPPKVPCGTGVGTPPCASGELCVLPGGLGDMPYCAKNPCPPSQPVTCACAGVLCTYGFCSGASPSQVTCECPNC